MWFTSLKPACTDAFSHDSDPMKEARTHYFATHPYDWVHGSFDDLSDIFKELARGAGLLGKSIYEIQLSWDGPEKLKQSNCALWSLPKDLRFLRAVPANESPKVMGLKGIHDPDALWQFAGFTYLWQGGAEWRDRGQSPEDNPLQARSCVWPVFWLSNSDVRYPLLAQMP